MTHALTLLPMLAVALLVATATARAGDHDDLVGTWTWALPKTGCTMTRTFQADGTTKVISGRKTTTGKYTVKWNRERTSRTVISDILTDEGGVDCDESGGSLMGKRFLFYVVIENGGMQMCLDPSRTACMGPYRKR